MDRLLGEIDKAIKVLAAPAQASRALEGAPVAEDFTPAEQRRSARLMRVNHAGEVAAQALYQGQALTARDPQVREALQHAGAEEYDHLAWCEQRLSELGGPTSRLNPLWYAGSFALGAIAGTLGDVFSLGFVAETERQVEAHLRDSMDRLSSRDLRSRSILTRMTHDEIRHGQNATTLGGNPLPFAVVTAMRATSRLMTQGSYWI